MPRSGCPPAATHAPCEELEPAPEPGPWPEPGARFSVAVVKLAPDGSVVTEYPAEIVPGAAPPPWIAARAVWGNRLVVLDGLEFHPGDTLVEFFSPDHWFNAFAVHAPDGAFRGWYANVTYPTRFDGSVSPPRLIWHDLFVDVVAVPGGSPSVRDEDELAASRLAATSPALHARILAARDDILDRVESRDVPFDWGWTTGFGRWMNPPTTG